MSAPRLDEAQLLRLEEWLDECAVALAETLTSFGFAEPFVVTVVGDVRGHIAARRGGDPRTAQGRGCHWPSTDAARWSVEGGLMNDPNLFEAAIALRDRQIARLERGLAAARVEAETLRAELAGRAADLTVTGERVALFPSTRRSEYVAKAIGYIARLSRPEVQSRVIDRRVEETFERLRRYGLPEAAARADADALGDLLRAATNTPSNLGGCSE